MPTPWAFPEREKVRSRRSCPEKPAPTLPARAAGAGRSLRGRAPRAGRALLDLRLRADRPAHRRHARRRRERSVRDLLQPGGLRAARTPALRLQPDLDRAREHRRGRRGRAGARLQPADLRHRAGDARLPPRLARGERNHFAFSFLSRYDSDFDLGVSEASVSPVSPAAAAGFGREEPRGGVLDRRQLVAPRLAPRVARRLAFRRVPRAAQPSLAERRGSRPGVARAAFVGREHEYNHVRVLAKLGLAWRPGEWELASPPPSRVKLWADGKSVFNASVAASTGSRYFRPRRRRAFRRTITRRGRSRSARPASSGARWCTRRSSGSRRSRPTTSCRSSRRRSPAARRASRLVYSGQAKSVVNFASASSTGSARTSTSTAAPRATSRPTSRAATPSRPGTSPTSPWRQPRPRPHPLRARRGLRVGQRRCCSRCRPARGAACPRFRPLPPLADLVRRVVPERLSYPPRAWSFCSRSTRAAGTARRRGRWWRRPRSRRRPSASGSRTSSSCCCRSTC